MKAAENKKESIIKVYTRRTRFLFNFTRLQITYATFFPSCNSHIFSASTVAAPGLADSSLNPLPQQLLFYITHPRCRARKCAWFFSHVCLQDTSISSPPAFRKAFRRSSNTRRWRSSVCVSVRRDMGSLGNIS